jgi:TonB family protein
LITRIAAIAAFLLAAMEPGLAADETAPCPLSGKPPEPVMSTHILPPYPVGAVRTGEHGNTLLTVTVGEGGTAKEIAVTQSSGFETLDVAAASFIKSHWRWKPFSGDCSVLPAPLLVGFAWILDPPKADFGLSVSATEYPAGAAERYEWGDTYLNMTLDGAGTVTEGKIAYSSGYADLDEKALAMVKRAPGIFAGRPRGEQIMMARWNLPAPQKDNIERVVIISRKISGP